MKNIELKKRIIEISYKLRLGHIGSCLTAVDIIEEIYKIKKPDEKFVLSSGHAHLAHLVVMEKYLHPESLDPGMENHKPYIQHLIEKNGIHCDRMSGCDVSTGSLGHGIGIAIGMALADRNKNVYCLLSDGEMAEGSVWEALHIIRDEKIDNIKIYLNDNGYGAYKETYLGAIPNFIKWRFTNMDDYPKWLQGQIAHYKVLNEAEYKELMKILK